MMLFLMFFIVYVRSFVEDRRGRQVLATYCKNPRGCDGIVVLADDADYSEAVCSLCSTTFCAACDLPPHAPATCEMVNYCRCHCNCKTLFIYFKFGVLNMRVCTCVYVCVCMCVCLYRLQNGRKKAGI